MPFSSSPCSCSPWLPAASACSALRLRHALLPATPCHGAHCPEEMQAHETAPQHAPVAALAALFCACSPPRWAPTSLFPTPLPQDLPRARPAAALPLWHGCGRGASPPLARGADRPRRARMSKRRAKHPALPTALSPTPLQLVGRARRSQRPAAGHQRGSLGAARSAPEGRDTLPAPCPPADGPHGGTRVSLGPRMPQEAVRRPQRPRC